ncbi:TPA: hypothetical protein ACNIQM_000770 [Citrobacter werkmanii]
MKIERGYYPEDFPESFLEQLENLRGQDANSFYHPLYQEKLNVLFSRMSEIFFIRMKAAIGDVDFSDAPPLDAAATFYLSSEPSGDPRVDYIRSRVKVACDLMHVAQNLYGLNIFSSLYCLARGERQLSRAYFSPLLMPSVSVYRLRAASRSRRGRSGRPLGKHFDEAIEIARQFHLSVPTAKRHRIARVVTEELNYRYRNAPTVRTVENWLKRIGF